MEYPPVWSMLADIEDRHENLVAAWEAFGLPEEVESLLVNAGQNWRSCVQALPGSVEERHAILSSAWCITLLSHLLPLHKP